MEAATLHQISELYLSGQSKLKCGSSSSFCLKSSSSGLPSAKKSGFVGFNCDSISAKERRLRSGCAVRERLKRGSIRCRAAVGTESPESSKNGSYSKPAANFFTSEIDGDPDRPTEGLSSIDQAVEAIKMGKLVLVVDDEDRENEGDLIGAASNVSAEQIAFMVKHCSGLICTGLSAELCDRLELPLMVSAQENEEALHTAFTVSVDLRSGTTTGISASDRAATIRALAEPTSNPHDFKRPGHVFPLRSRKGGVLKRAGHTEAAVDLSLMAGLSPAGVLCEVVDQRDGSMARLPYLKEFAKEFDLPIISIADLIKYRRKRTKVIERTAVARLPTEFGSFQIYSFVSKLDDIEHVAMVKGDIGDGLDVLVRVHSECITGDIFQSRRCDCGPQLSQSLRRIEKEGRGVVVYLRGHEGRGIGLGHKLQAYNLQDSGRDTVEANIDLGLPVDSREYGVGAQILRDIGVRTMRLMTNNPAKFIGLKGYGLAVTGRVPILCAINKDNKRYIETKRLKMGHIYGSDMPGTIAGLFLKEESVEIKLEDLSLNGMVTAAVEQENGGAAAFETLKEAEELEELKEWEREREIKPSSNGAYAGKSQ